MVAITRTFDAPRARVFTAWTDQKELAQWWGPKGFTNPVCALDARPGGAIRVDMTGPDGTVYPMGGEFHEIAAPERLVFTSTAFADEAGKPGLAVRNTVTFAEQDGKTTLTLQADVVTAAPEVATAIAGMPEGWSQSLDRLADHVAAPKTITISRLYDAPRARVFQVYVEPEHIKHWCYGADGWTVPFAENDLRPGGKFRTGMRSPDGAIEFTFEGVYDEVVAPALIRYTIADGRPVTVTFDAVGDKTRITVDLTLETTHSVEQQRHGWSAIMDHLADHLATL